MSKQTDCVYAKTIRIARNEITERHVHTHTYHSTYIYTHTYIRFKRTSVNEI